MSSWDMMSCWRVRLSCRGFGKALLWERFFA
jgi:hypothetical protein